jgi:hypothetical protein
MTTKVKKTVIRVDASVFEKKSGDRVEKGEILGHFTGSAVKVPFDGIIEGISFEPDDHTLIVVVKEEVF